MRFVTLNEDNIVVSIRNGTKSIDGEFESEIGQIGQRMLEDGTFVDVPIESAEEIPSIEEQILTETQYQTALLEMQMLGGI